VRNCVAVVALILCFLARGGEARTISGVTLSETQRIGEQTFVLNGAGVRRKWFVDVYVAGLYLTRPSRDASKILADDEPMLIRLQLLSGLVTAKRMRAAAEEGFERATGSHTEPIRSYIDTLLRVFEGPLEKGDVFVFGYEPGKGIRLSRNGEYLGRVGGGLEFKRAFFGIWLGERPIQRSLERALLGD